MVRGPWSVVRCSCRSCDFVDRIHCNFPKVDLPKQHEQRTTDNRQLTETQDLNPNSRFTSSCVALDPETPSPSLQDMPYSSHQNNQL
jgi:hypothetical protein